MPSNSCLPDFPPRPAPGRRLPRAVLVVVIVFAAAALPLTLIGRGMPPAVALSTAGAVAAFAVGVARQILGLVAGVHGRVAGVHGRRSARATS
jgi:hypothetical protein